MGEVKNEHIKNMQEMKYMTKNELAEQNRYKQSVKEK